ncbi:MAG TPA: myo-inosose-2 dehydratase [Acetobacteraceae bacterium]|jgi:inosose dehydratase/3D-(3,5/4)-trihydroxycyclohexane-1,2-dione acylhydrolase (decyclizing)
MIRIGTNPIGWSNDDLRELGGSTPLETCLSEARQAGYEGIELGHKFPRRPEALRPLLQAHGLDLVSGWYSASLRTRSVAEEQAALRPHLDLLKAMGCAVLVFAETSGAVHGDRATALSRRPVMADTDWRPFAAKLTELADAVAAEGVALAYHHHMGTVVQTGEDIDLLMAATGASVKLLLDTGHATFAGADPVALARRYRARVAHVHCKDTRPTIMREAQDRDWSFLDAVVAGVFTVPGDGGVDFPGTLRELPDYSGWLVVEAEQDPVKAHPLTYARIGYENLRRFAADAGLLAPPSPALPTGAALPH